MSDSFHYFVVDTDGAYGIRESASREQFLFTDVDTVVGVGGHSRVRLGSDFMMAGYVNDCGLVSGLERNVVGGVLLAVLGAARQPYAGPVVLVGWNPAATVLGELEVQSLMEVQLGAVRSIVSDIRIVLGMDEGTPVHDDLLWAAGVRTFAEYVRTGEAPTMRVVSGDDAVAHMLGVLREREGMSGDCGRDRHGRCPTSACRCGCHDGQEYVPLRGWLPAAQAREDRRAYLDEDAAIERFHGNEGD